MAGGPLSLSVEERGELARLIRSHSTPQQLARRARMIVLMADGLGVGETAERLGVWRKGVSQWRARWLSSSPAMPVGRAAQGCGAAIAPLGGALF